MFLGTTAGARGVCRRSCFGDTTGCGVGGFAVFGRSNGLAFLCHHSAWSRSLEGSSHAGCHDGKSGMIDNTVDRR